MSGIVGILNLNGRPVEPLLLQRLTSYLEFRGPDASDTWISGPLGFGHTLLQTTTDTPRERQPFSLNGQVWIIADARIDDRPSLAKKLGLDDRIRHQQITDVELILQAYLSWGQSCVEHLLGDFAFAIWDERKQLLFCARDQMGVKPFYYAQVGNTLVWSNTVNCLRLHPEVSSRLNEQAIGDFLIARTNYNETTTFFVDIKRLQPAHILSVQHSKDLSIRRYWTMPRPDLIRYNHVSDYVDHFKEVMGEAVADRLRTEKVAISFSGGLDSATVAATALDVAKQTGKPLDLQGFTAVYDQLIPDRERYFSGLSAKALGFPLHYQVLDGYDLFDGMTQIGWQVPEPTSGSNAGTQAAEQQQKIAGHSRVVLYGHGGDELFRGNITVLDSLKWLPPWKVTQYAIWLYQLQHFRPPVGLNLGKRVQTLLGRKLTAASTSAYPVFLNQKFEERLNLPARWEQIYGENIQPLSGRLPSYEQVNSPLWPMVFEGYDIALAENQLEARYPYLDLRVLNYALALPALPWCYQKSLLRQVLSRKIPEEVRHRPKTPVVSDPTYILIAQGHNLVSDLAHASPQLAEYIDIDRYTQEIGLDKLGEWRTTMRLLPICLGYWLRQLETVPVTV